MEVDYLDIIESTVKQEGVEVFDVDLPSSGQGILRIYIWKGKEKHLKGEQTNLNDCATIARRLMNNVKLQNALPDGVIIEVSTPGINRKLKRVDHFQSALGEHIKLKYYDKNEEAKIVKGQLLEADDRQIVVELDNTKDNLKIVYSNIAEARVDFVF